MARRSYRPEQIIKKLREAEVLLSQGSTIGEAARKIGVTEQTYYRWRREYGGMRIEQVKRLKELREGEYPAQKSSSRSFPGQCNSQGGIPGKLLSPSKRRKMIGKVLKTLKVSERRACRVLGQARTTQRHSSHIRNDEERLVARIIKLATRYGRYGYRRTTALLNQEGWKVNHKRVERIWRREGLKVPKKQPKRGRLWLNDGSCTRLRPEHKDHVWSYDFMVERTAEGKAFRILTIIDEYTRECLAILTQRRITSQDVIEQLFYLFIFRGTTEYIHSDNGPEFTAKAVRRWLNDLEVTTLFIEPGSPWENGYIESFNGKLRDELLNREVFTTLIEAKILIEEWRKEYNQVRPHSALDYRPPAPEAIVPLTLT